MNTEETTNNETESHDSLVDRVLQSRFGNLMPKDEHHKLMRELVGIHYTEGRPVESPNILPPSRTGRVTTTKSPATLVSLGEQPLPIETIVAPEDTPIH